jgi:hypothetical protein
MGGATTASGSYSTSMGYGTTASGSTSTAIGKDMIVSGDYSVGIGLDVNNPDWEISQDNTMAIMGGKVGIGTTSPSTTLHIDGDVAFGAGSELTISSGVVTATHSYHHIDTESDAVTDDLDTINGGSVAGEILIIRAANDGRTIVVRDVSSSITGNLILSGGSNFNLNDLDDTLVLMYDGTNWLELSQSDNS